MATTQNNILWVWGFNCVGEMGTGNQSLFLLPEPVRAMRELRATDISAGYWHSAIVATDMPDESVPMWREPNCHPTMHVEDDEEGHDSLVVVHRVAQEDLDDPMYQPEFVHVALANPPVANREKFRWDLKVNHLSGDGGIAAMIGVALDSVELALDPDNQDGAMCYMSTGERFDGSEGFGEIEDYAEPWWWGDVIGVEVNREVGYVRFYKNGVDQGIAFYADWPEDARVHLYVALAGDGDKISIIDDPNAGGRGQKAAILGGRGKLLCDNITLAEKGAAPLDVFFNCMSCRVTICRSCAYQNSMRRIAAVGTCFRLSARFSTSRVLPPPRLDYEWMASHVNDISRNISDRGMTGDPAKVRDLYEKLKQIQRDTDKVRNKRNILANEIPKLKDKQARDMAIAEAKGIKARVQGLEAELREVRGELERSALKLPNTTYAGTPVGSETDALELSTFGQKKKWGSFTPLSHIKLCEIHNLVDFEAGALVAGSSWPVLRGDAALLEVALINWSMQKISSRGFTPTIVPDVCRVEMLEACGFNPRGKESQTYFVGGGDCDNGLAMVGTAEIPLAGVAANHSAEIMRELVDLQVELLSDLNLHGRVLEMPTGELGSSASRKIDVEIFMPGRNEFGEVCSASDCTDYQSRRLNTQFVPSEGGKRQFVSTLNATGLAIPRVIIGLLESGQKEDGSIELPGVLTPYMGKDVIALKLEPN
eukprot:g1868.t1